MHNYVRFAAIAWLTLIPLLASEHRGFVKFGGLPVPGATVTAAQGEKKLVAVTDEQGIYSFPEFPDGEWSMHIEMLCFSPLDRTVAIAGGAPAGDWELKL